MANEATTSTPDKEEVTPQGSKEAITSEKPKGESTPPAEENKEVTELKGKVETLEKQLKEAQMLQSQADKKRKAEEKARKKLEDKLERIRSGEISVEEEIPEGESSEDKETRLQVRIAVQNLILDNPDYQELLKQDITLKEVIRNNPLALVGEFLDAEDAVEQIRDKLEQRVSSLKKSQPIKEEKKEEEPPEFEPGPVQPPETSEVPPKEKTPKSLDESLEESIKGKIKFT